MKYAQPRNKPVTRQVILALAAACCAIATAHCPAAEETQKPSIQYVPVTAPAEAPKGIWMSAVIVDEMPLVYTRQLYAMDGEGKLVGEGSAEKQIEQVLTNLEAVLKDSGSGLDKLIRVNVYALSQAIVADFHEQLAKRLDASVRPATTSILTPLPQQGALVAVDAVAGAADAGKTVTLKRCKTVAGNDKCADAAVLPAGGIAYLSGNPEVFSLTTLPTTKSMTRLMKTLEQLKLSPKDVVQVRVFLNPVTPAQDVLAEIQAFFPDQPTPPVVFVEWLASMPVEIEMVAQLPPSDKPAKGVEYFDPPEFRPDSTFSRVGLMRAKQQIFISGLYSSKPTRGQPQADDLFGQLKEILAKHGSDMRHLVRATYFTSDDDAARWIDKTRFIVFDETRPPAASKLMVHGVGLPGRSMTVDIIAVETEK
ncbi:MAG: RidA family protein [Planctomycetaceae bacterium]|nr:RidA family protein [Planctomycetaceae bacterium]